MKPHGTYKLIHRARGRCFAPRSARPEISGTASRADSLLSRVTESEARIQRILDSLRQEITGNDEDVELRVRRIFSTPRSVYRVELSVPELGYHRITLLEEDALEELLEDDGVRTRIERSLL